ncbi:MAG TPA: hypothetical protein VFJ90_17130, partial [Candidatus Didemnitutus sp.]|nr:hypothetical protein [Candidatus Didemnitutus sp.]
LHVEQSKALCGKLTRSPMAVVDGNVYIRRGPGPERTLISWSPTAGENCSSRYATLAAFKTAEASYEAHGAAYDGYFGAVFRSEELSNLQPVRDFPSEAAVPPVVLALLGWQPGQPLIAGAYQHTK